MCDYKLCANGKAQACEGQGLPGICPAASASGGDPDGPARALPEDRGHAAVGGRAGRLSRGGAVAYAGAVAGNGDKEILTMARILVIDDYAGILDVLELMLTAAGHQVMTAGTGIAGLELAGQSPPDLVLLDVDMPGMDGVSVCLELKRNM